MQNEITFIGGDLRNVELINLYANENYKIYTYGFEKYDFLDENIIKMETLKVPTETVISSIPFSKDGEYINSAFAEKKISIEELFNQAKGKKIIAGAISPKMAESALSYNVELVDLMKNEELTILNVIPTAEGAIAVAMEESKETIHGNNSLVLGFGRIGKVLSKMLLGLGANVYSEARKKEDLAYIEALGYNKIDLKDLNNYLPRFKYIFNTIPSMILDKERLDLINKDAIIIDLASSPGGVDFDYARKIGINAILALGLPGKVAPRTAAKYIYDILVND